MSTVFEVPVQDPVQTHHLRLSGTVQGVGFRPFIFRIAKSHELTGWVRNDLGTVEIEVQGKVDDIDAFMHELIDHPPALAEPVIDSHVAVSADSYQDFEIRESTSSGEASISVPRDLFLCDDCLAELQDPDDRRYDYPFINCTQCGPRFTLIERMPYDRQNTTMSSFEMCPDCRAEYEDPTDRRYHAEPIACPECGPSISFHHDGVVTRTTEASLILASDHVIAGGILALKGVGGYHLVCDASNEVAVASLRERKARPHKPLAVMFPSSPARPLARLMKSLTPGEEEARLLSMASRPIVLCRRKESMELAENIAPGIDEVGAMLPYSPLHQLLLQRIDIPLVMTSANISGEPVLTENDEVERRLGHIAHAFMHHDRPIERPADDPVYRVIDGAGRPIRIGRGVAPLERSLPSELSHPVLAVGAQMKNTITIAWGDRAVISPHIGEMESLRSLEVFNRTIEDLQQLYDVRIESIVCDLHPGYTSSRWAREQGIRHMPVQHHQAHASAAWTEAGAKDDVIAFTWDGTGYGDDGSLWGGETFIGAPGRWQRQISLRPLGLPGGDRASREPWRCAATIRWVLGQSDPSDDPMMYEAWQRGINTPMTSSIGRLFDAAAALTGTLNEASYEAQAAMMFESVAARTDETIPDIVLPMIEEEEVIRIDWVPLMRVMMDEQLSVAVRAAAFHRALANNLLAQAQFLRRSTGIASVVLCGGVFQNRVLTEFAISLLEADGFTVTLPELVPINDAGISFGQVIEYASRTRTTGE